MEGTKEPFRTNLGELHWNSLREQGFPAWAADIETLDLEWQVRELKAAIQQDGWTRFRRGLHAV